MKKLSIEEKAQAYDEAIKKVNDFYEGKTKLYSDVDKTLNYLFPELKESEDERIIHWIRKELEDKYVTDNIVNNEMADKALAWLEKQGEQKPADKVKSKFNVGDWIVSNVSHEDYRICKILNDDGEYIIESIDGYRGHNNFETFDKDYHLWTIQDAKDGDILSWDDSKCIALFKNIYDKDSFNSYGFVGHCTDTFESRPTYHDIEGAHPATKEQRNLLFQKMKDAGYTFDFEKKELKKIEQMSAWSEEDEKIYSRICALIHSAAYKNYDVDEDGNECGEYANIKGWFKKLKDRVQPQPKQEWSEKDENMLQSIIATCEFAEQDRDSSPARHLFEMQANWLKSLKERVSNFDEGYKVGFSAAKYIQWQPSEDVYKK